MAKGGRFAKNNNRPKLDRSEQVLEQPLERKENLHQEKPVKIKKEKKQSGGFATALVTIGVVLVLVLSAVVGISVYQATMNRMAANKPTVPTMPQEAPAPTLATQPAEVVEETEETVPPTTELPYTPSGMDIINVLVVGDSAREGEGAKLADTMILASINKKTKMVTLTSFLRDAYVDLPNYMGHKCGWNRINVAYNLGYKWGDQGGALEMTNITLKDNFGVEVDYNVVVDFDGFINAVNVLGEIYIELTEAEAEYINNTLNKALGGPAYNYKAVYEDGNTYTGMGGWECLTYARMRKAKGDGDSDIKRTARQRKLIEAIMNKVKGSDMNTLMTFAKEIMSQLTTDMTDDEILTCMWEILPMLTDLKIESQTMPAEGTYGALGDRAPSEEVRNALSFDPKENKEIMMAIAEADQLPVEPTTGKK